VFKVAAYEPEWTLQTGPLPGGDAGVKATVGAMRGLVHKDLFHPWVRGWVADVLAPLNPGQPDALLQRLAETVRRSFQYVRGPYQVQLLTAPFIHAYRLRSARSRFFGNCADLTMMQAVCCMTVGFHCRYVTVATGTHGQAYNHIFCEVETGSGWRSMDFLVDPKKPLVRAPAYWEA